MSSQRFVKRNLLRVRVNDSFEEFSGVHVSGNLVAGTPDTISESGSMKSRSRRTLPYLPPEEPAPLPTQAKKAQERMRYTPTALLTRYILTIEETFTRSMMFQFLSDYV